MVWDIDLSTAWDSETLRLRGAETLGLCLRGIDFGLSRDRSWEGLSRGAWEERGLLLSKASKTVAALIRVN